MSNLKGGPWVCNLYRLLEGFELGHMGKKNGEASWLTSELNWPEGVSEIFDTIYLTDLTILINDVIFYENWPFSKTRGGLFDFRRAKDS